MLAPQKLNSEIIGMDDMLIIGCGRTAAAIAKRIDSFDSINRFYLNSRTKKGADDLKAKLNKDSDIIMDLSNFDFPRYVMIALSATPDIEWRQVALSSKDTTEIRIHELLFNFYAVYDHAQTLKERAKDSTIIVVTNPVDILTNYLKRTIGLKDVIGFGLSLDSERYRNILSYDRSMPTPNCIGIHGEAVPILGWNDTFMYDSLYRRSDRNLLEYAQKYGMPYDFCGERFVEFFKAFTSDKENVLQACVELEGYQGLSRVCMSVPIRVRDGRVLGYENIKINDVEKEIFYKINQRIQGSLNAMNSLHKSIDSIANKR